MVVILKVYDRPPLVIRLKKVQETASGHTWIFTFWEKTYGFMQSVIIPKHCPAEAMESAYEKIWTSWQDEARYRDLGPGRN